VISVSASYSAAIANRKVRMAEIVDVLLASGENYRYTNHPKDITWNAAGDTYSSVLAGEYRGPISFNTDGAFDECEINIGIISGALRDKIKKNILEAAQITIRLIRWDAAWAADEEIILFVGVPDVSFNSKSLRLRLVSQLDSLNILVPRDSYQSGCNRYPFDDVCGLPRADYAYAGSAVSGSATTLVDTTAGTLYSAAFDGGDSADPIEIGDALVGGHGTPGAGVCINIVYLTASTGTIWYAECSHQFVDNEVITGGGNTVTVNGAPAEDTAYYEMGELEMLTGDNAGESRPILSSSGSTRTVLWPFPNAVAAADTYKIYPGCDGRAATCLARFNNLLPWRAFPFVPLFEEIIM